MKQHTHNSVTLSTITNRIQPIVTALTYNTNQIKQSNIVQHKLNMSTSTNIPTTISAIRVHKTGNADVLQYDNNVQLPELKSNDVLVEIAYSGINFIDTYQRSGLYPVQLPFVLGREASGIVRVIGSNVSNINVGDRVGFMSQGTYAQYTVTDQSNIIKIPDNVSLRDAAAVLLQGLTAHYLTHSTFPLSTGHTALVHAAAGGTGALIVQLAKLRGARVIATAGSNDKVEQVKQLGADHVINYNETDFLTAVKQYTNNTGVNVVYDGVGKATWENSLKSLDKLGCLVLFGNASGAVPPLDPLLLSKHGSLFVTRPTLVDYIAKPGSLKQRSDELFSYIAQHKATVRIGKVFKLEQAADAQRYIESRQSTGKILLAVNENLQ